MRKRSRLTRPPVLSVAVVAVALVLAACGGGDEDEGDTGGEGTTVSVELADFAVTPDVTSVAAGAITFVATNAGPSEHELVVLRTDLAPDALPVEGGMAAEDASGIEETGEIEEFEAGGTESATFELPAGSYVLICNIPGHYQAGMAVAFEVV